MTSSNSIKVGATTMQSNHTNSQHNTQNLRVMQQSSFANRYGRYADVVAALGVSRTTVYRWTLLDNFPAEAMKKRGSIVLFNLDVLEAWLAGEVTA